MRPDGWFQNGIWMLSEWCTLFWLFLWLSAWESIQVGASCVCLCSFLVQISDGMRNGKCKKTSLSCELLLFPITFVCISVLVHVFVFKTCWAILQLFSCYSLFTRSMTYKSAHDKEKEKSLKHMQKGRKKKKNLV